METTLTPEAEFVFRLVQRIGNRNKAENRIQEIARSNPDWNTIVRLVSGHHLHSVLRSAVCEIDLSVPQEIVQRLDAQHRENSVSNLEHSSQLYELNELFESNDVAALPYKGPILAEVAYGDIGDRSFVDLDFLISKGDVKKACDLLERQGYERINFADIPVETLVDGTVFRWGREFRFVDSDGRLPVELRFGFIGGESSDSKIFADLWERRTPTTLAGRTVSALSQEDRALLLLVHGTKHGWRQLSWVYDVGLLLKQDIDWELVFVRAEKYHWRNAILYGLAVIAELTDLSVPEPIQPELDSNRLCLWGARQTVARLRDDLDGDLLYLEPITTAMFLNDDLRGAFVDGIDEILAPRKADYELVSLPTTLHPLYYVVRTFRFGAESCKRFLNYSHNF